MKKITCGIIAMLSVVTLHSQDSGSELYTTEVDKKIENLNKTSITSNILIDRVLSVSDILSFNQEARKDTTSYEHFKQVWYELYQASYVKNFSSLEEFNDKLNIKNYSTNTVPIGIINTEFHYGDAGTTQNPNVGFNSSTQTFYNISGKNPFFKKQATIISPLVSKVVGNTIIYKIDADSKLYKQGKTIKNLQLLTNGTTFNLISNFNINTGTFETNYQTEGVKVIKFITTLSDNTQKISYAKLYVGIPDRTTLQKSSTTIPTLTEIQAHSDLAFQGYNESQEHLGKNEYRIYYNDSDNVLDKPFIILDGFDPGDTRKIERTDIGHNQGTKSIVELMNFGNENFIDKLKAEGYDVVIVNHKGYTSNGKHIDGGTDYIERNAFVLISLIRELKQLQQGNEEMVILGPSMGGLISRYALAFMEKKLAETGDNTKWNHNTRLWVSFDSPHQGANVPIGAQYWLRFHDFLGKVKEKINEFLDTPAAKQMLVDHFLANVKEVAGAPNFRNRFQNSLDNLGMPQNLRKISLVNGSIFGKNTGIGGREILNIEINPTIITFGLSTALTGFLMSFEGIHSNVYFTPGVNNESRVFDGRIRVSTFGIGWNLSRRLRVAYSGNKGSYDNAPGGLFDTQNILFEEAKLDEWYYKLFVKIDKSLSFKTHGFIPTKSALAFNGNTFLYEYLADKNLVCTGETPFDSYYAPENNEEHIFLTNENVSWLIEEIKGNPQLPPVYVKPFTIGGENTICYTEYKTFNISETINSCQGETQWSVSDNLIVTSQTNNSITVTPVNSSINGLGRISAKRQGENIMEDEKGFWIGKPLNEYSSYRLVGSTQVYSKEWSRFEGLSEFLIPSFEQDLYTFDYEWSIPNSEVRYSDNNRIANVYPFYTGTIDIGLRLKNRCGCTDWHVQSFNVEDKDGSGGGGNIITPIRIR